MGYRLFVTQDRLAENNFANGRKNYFVVTAQVS